MQSEGARLQVFESFLALAAPGATTRQVVALIKQFTQSSGSALWNHMRIHFQNTSCAYLGGITFNSAFGVPNKFLSHAWDEVFADVVAAVREFDATHSGSIYYFDCFSEDQHHTNNLVGGWAANFQNKVGTIGHTVLVFTKWHYPFMLTRSWCLWEIFCALNSGAQLTIQLSKPNAAILDNNQPLTAPVARWMEIDVATAAAGSVQDKNWILDQVTQAPGGVLFVNQQIKNRLVLALGGAHLQEWPTPDHILQMKQSADGVILCMQHVQAANPRVFVRAGGGAFINFV